MGGRHVCGSFDGPGEVIFNANTCGKEKVVPQWLRLSKVKHGNIWGCGGKKGAKWFCSESDLQFGSEAEFAWNQLCFAATSLKGSLSTTPHGKWDHLHSEYFVTSFGFYMNISHIGLCEKCFHKNVKLSKFDFKLLWVHLDFKKVPKIDLLFT